VTQLQTIPENDGAQHLVISAADYHACAGVGSSMLECFRDSRRTYHARYVAKTEPPPGPTAAMQLGTLVHLKLLEPARFDEAVAAPLPEVAPDGKAWLRRKGSDHEKWWAEELESRAGKIAADQETLATVDLIVASVLSNWHARKLLERDGEPEFPIFWHDKETGLPLKCLVDWWSSLPLDIKTTRDPSPQAFAKDCVTLGYHRKRAHYLAGIQAFSGEDLPLIHLAVGNQPPFACCCYELDDTDWDGKSLGFRQWRKTLRQLAECYETDDWSEPYERQIVSLRLPGWAFSEESYSIT
jgi:hypothetical protein